MPKVSVLMPVYNAADYLAEAIDSIIGQTFADWELIIVDDGSTDRSEDVVQSYSDKRIRFLKNVRNEGIIYTRNYLIEESKGEYLAIFDSDDISYPTRLQHQVDFLDTHKDYGFCGTWAIMIDSEGNKIKKLNLMNSHNAIKCSLLFSNTFIQSSILIRREILGDAYRYNPDFPVVGDYEFWSRLIKVCKAENLKKHLVAYRWHQSNISNRQRERAHLRKREVHRYELKCIGIDATDHELDIHALQSTADNSHLLGELKQWFRKLNKVTKGDNQFDRNTFVATLCFRWIFACKSRGKYMKALSLPVFPNIRAMLILLKMLYWRTL